MAVSDWLHRLAARAPVPVMVARGVGSALALARLRADPAIRVVATPRHATVLVVAGAIPNAQLEALAAVHDQVPTPRGVATLGVAGDLAELGLGDVARLPDDDPGGTLRQLHADVLAGRVTAPAIGRADHPVDWQGVGPHGQGGEGMMGGTPYGRMMPMPPTEGRDGLALDRLSLRLGPFLAGLPAGLALDVGLQGDVLEEVDLVPADLDDGLVGTPSHEADLATSRLAALAELCAVAGLDALARRAARVTLDPTSAGVEHLRRLLDRPWGLRAATDGVGRLDDGTDVTDRWRAWLRHAAAPASGGSSEETPRSDVGAITEALRGQELGRAWMTLCSLQPDLDPGVDDATRVGAR